MKKFVKFFFTKFNYLFQNMMLIMNLTINIGYFTFYSKTFILSEELLPNLIFGLPR